MQAPYKDATDWSVLGTRNLIQDAQTALSGQISRTPEAELALALLDRLTTTVRELHDVQACLDDIDY